MVSAVHPQKCIEGVPELANDDLVALALVWVHFHDAAVPFLNVGVHWSSLHDQMNAQDLVEQIHGGIIPFFQSLNCQSAVLSRREDGHHAVPVFIFFKVLLGFSTTLKSRLVAGALPLDISPRESSRYRLLYPMSVDNVCTATRCTPCCLLSSTGTYVLLMRKSSMFALFSNVVKDCGTMIIGLL